MIAATQAPSTIARLRTFATDRLKSAKTTRYSSVRLAPSHAAPFASAHVMLRNVHAVKSANAASATCTTRGRRRRLEGSVATATARTASSSSVPGYQERAKYPPWSVDHATSTPTPASAGSAAIR